MVEGLFDDSINYSFIFVCDRSGSMWGIRMEIVVEALQLFMQSLPGKCTFKIISFGDKFTCNTGSSVVKYNDSQKE